MVKSKLYRNEHSFTCPAKDRGVESCIFWNMWCFCARMSCYTVGSGRTWSNLFPMGKYYVIPCQPMGLCCMMRLDATTLTGNYHNIWSLTWGLGVVWEGAGGTSNHYAVTESRPWCNGHLDAFQTDSSSLILRIASTATAMPQPGVTNVLESMLATTQEEAARVERPCCWPLVLVSSVVCSIRVGGSLNVGGWGGMGWIRPQEGAGSAECCYIFTPSLVWKLYTGFLRLVAAILLVKSQVAPLGRLERDVG